MAKNKNRLAQAQGLAPGAPQAPAYISAKGWKVIGAGAGIVALGFIVLSFTDPAGQNWASRLSPFLILGGYAAIGVGLFLPPAPPPANPAIDPK